MALHRDIFWVGRQWAVTGYGMQAVDQKRKAKFDIEASRVWEDGLSERMRAEGWLNLEDFDKALVVARKRFPQPPGAIAPLREAVSYVKQAPVEAPNPTPQTFNMRVEGWPAKFVQPWRIRSRR